MEVWQTLAPYVSALPGVVTVNVNTASAEVLAATVIEWGFVDQALSEAQKWTATLSRQPIDDINALAARMFGEGGQPAPTVLGITSGYFMAHTQLNFDNVEYRMASLYHRNEGKAVLLRHNRELL